MEEYKKFWRNYTNFSGRSTRKDFWMAVLFNFVVSMILSFISVRLSGIFTALTIVPSLAIAFRRLHDTNRSGGWIFINVLPFIGSIIYLIFMVSSSVDEGNNYGEIAE